MQLTKTILCLICGVSSGITLVISCGDNYRLDLDAGPAGDAPQVDAAPAPVCGCPAVEPPLAGRIVVLTTSGDIPANWTGARAVRCLTPGPRGAVFGMAIGGSCMLDPSEQNRNVTLMESGFYNDLHDNWFCIFHNHESVPVTMHASTICLMPPS
jgi:hypothetical protein